MIKKLLSIAIFLFAFITASAQLGGEITYRSLDSNHYEITAIVYRDCRGLPLNSIGLSVSASGVTSQTIFPTRVSIQEVKYHCNSTADKCSPANTYGTGYGSERHTFKDTIDFSAAPFNTSGWTSACEINVSYATCCRNNSSAIGSGGLFYINAMFNKCKARLNNSPIFTNQPLFRVPLSQKNVYSYGMVDSVDNDSLSIKMIAAKTGASTSETYIGTSSNCSKTYTPTMPLTAYQFNPCGPYMQNTTQGFYLDAYTAELYFTPTAVNEHGPIVVEATEWRKNNSGVYEAVGTIMRESFVIVEAMPTNNAPNLTGPFIYTVNAGDNIQFNITSSDQVVIPPPPATPPSPDTLIMTWDSAISGATFTISNPAARLPTGKFSWTPTCDDVRDEFHRFTVTVRDNNCSTEIRSSRTVLVKVKRIKDIDLGSDIALCDGDSVQLGAINSYGGSLLWSTNETTNTITVDTSGTYYVMGVNFCNDTTYDTINVNLSLKPVVDLGPDTNLCEGVNYPLYVVAPNANSILWSNSLITDTILADSGLYWVTVNDKNCGIYKDSVHITRHAIPNLYLPTDTIVCNSDTIELTYNSPNAESVIWKNAVTSPSIEVSEANVGVWPVYLLDKYCGEFRDTVTVKHFNKPTVNLGSDTTYCGSYTDTLDAGSDSFPQTYLWHPGNQTSQTKVVNQFGVYWVDVTNACGTTTDSISILDTTNLFFSLGSDKLICDKDDITLSTSIPNATYQWSTNANDTNNSVVIDSTGLYWVEITLCSQTKRDSIFVTFDSTPVVNLGADTTFNGTVSDTLDAGNAGSTYLWSTSDTTQTIIVDTTGTYWVTATNQCGSDTDSITISLVGIDNIDIVSDNINVYPNPSSGIFNISFENIKVAEIDLVITSIDGREILHKNIHANKGYNYTEKLDVSELPPGMYYLVLKTDRGNSTLKIIISK